MENLSRRYFVGLSSLAVFGAAVGGAVMGAVTTALVDEAQARRDRLEALLVQHRKLAKEMLSSGSLAKMTGAFDKLDQLARDVVGLARAMVKDGEVSGVGILDAPNRWWLDLSCGS